MTWPARLGGARRRGPRGWEGHGDVARAAGRGVATWPAWLEGGAATRHAGVQGHGEVGACQHRRGR